MYSFYYSPKIKHGHNLKDIHTILSIFSWHGDRPKKIPSGYLAPMPNAPHEVAIVVEQEQGQQERKRNECLP